MQGDKAINDPFLLSIIRVQRAMSTRLIFRLVRSMFLALGLWVSLGHAMLAAVVKKDCYYRGKNRPYLMSGHSSSDRLTPVVIMFGGINSTAESAARNFGWVGLSEEKGVLAVFPSPLLLDISRPFSEQNNPTIWRSNTPSLVNDPSFEDDDGYLLLIIDQLIKHESVDPKKIFLAGFSSGAIFAQTFASRHPDRIAAIAVVGNSLYKKPKRRRDAVSILYIHGDLDLGQSHNALSPTSNLSAWLNFDECTGAPLNFHLEWGSIFRGENCKQGSDVEAFFIEQLGHQWLLENSVLHQRFATFPPSFTMLAWMFFSKHGKQ